MRSKWILMAALTTILSTAVPGMAQTSAAASPKDQTQQTSEKKAVKATLPAPTEQEISDAKAKGMVWVNFKTKVYHQADSQFYGKTKHGKFMTEAEATKGGFNAAKEPASKNTKKSATQAKK